MAYEDLVQKYYVGFFGRPADPDGLEYWSDVVADAGGDTSALEAGFAASQEYQDFVLEDGGVARTNSEIVNFLYNNLFGRDAEAAGLAHWTWALDNDIVSPINIVSTLIENAQGTDATAFANKIDVANYFTNNLKNLPYTGADIPEVRDLLDDITYQTATVDAAKDAVDDWLYETLGLSLETDDPAQTSVEEGEAIVFKLSAENGTAGDSYSYKITGISQNDVVGGQLTGTATLGADETAYIQITLKADALTEGTENLTLTVEEESVTVEVEDTSLDPLPPVYTLTADADSVGEDGTVKFVLQAENVAAGANYSYTITGVEAADIVGGALSGTVTLDANLRAVIEIELVEDETTEGDQSLTVTIGDDLASDTVVVEDTSLDPDPPVYELTADAAAVDEGGTATFVLQAENVAPNSTYSYTISGVQAADVVGGKLSGTVTLDANLRAVIEIELVKDFTTEGDQDLTVTIGDGLASDTVTVVDASVDPEFELTRSVGGVNEGGTVQFTLEVLNDAAPGSTYAYEITGVDASDVVGGVLSGTVTLDADLKAVITVELAEDETSEGTETLTLAVAGESKSVLVFDTSTTNIVLTPGVDVPPYTQGTEFGDTFTGNAETLTSGDRLVGGGGDDVFNYAVGTFGGSTWEAGFETSGIELFNLTADEELEIDMSGTSGVETVRDVNSRENMNLTNGDEIVDLEMVNTTVAHDLVVDYQADRVDGNDDVQNILVDRVLAGSTIQVDAVETFNLDTEGTASDLYWIGGNDLETLNIDLGVSLDVQYLNIHGDGVVNVAGTGDLFVHDLDFDDAAGTGLLETSNTGDIEIDRLTFYGNGDVDADNGGDLLLYDVEFGAGDSSIDASGIGGMMDLTLSNADATGVNVAVTGSVNNDVINVEAGFNLGDTIDGNDGDDLLEANAEDFDDAAVGVDAVSNVETLELNSGTLSVLDLDWFDTVLATVYVNTGTANDIYFQNLEADGSERLVIDNYEAALDGKSIWFDGPSNGQGNTTVTLEVNNVDTPTSVVFADYDDDGVAPDWDDPVYRMDLDLNGDSVFIANLDEMDSLSQLGLEGDADIEIYSLGAQQHYVWLVEGAGTTGDVTIGDHIDDVLWGATVTLGSGYDIVWGSSIDDNIDITTGGGIIQAGDGNDTLSASGDDPADAVEFYGGNGADTLNGSGADDTLYGNGGVDTVYGNGGDDWIVGGLGADQLYGGDGDDVFAYEFVTESQGAAFADTINDFVSGEDVIDLEAAINTLGFNINGLDMVRFVGNANGFAAAQSALSGIGGVEIVYDTQMEAVYVDLNGDGLIDGLNDMIIYTPGVDAMAAEDFGLTPSSFFTAAVGPFQTNDAADSFENTTTSGGNDTVIAEASELPLSAIGSGGGGYDVLNVTTTITAAIDLGTIMDTDFNALNLFGGSTAWVTGPDQWEDLNIYLGVHDTPGFFENYFITGESYDGGDPGNFPDSTQRIYSAFGDDWIVLTNANDEAYTGDGTDWVELNGTYGGNGFSGVIETGEGDDRVYVFGGTTFGDGVMDGGGQIDDEIYAYDLANLSGSGEITGFDRIAMRDSNSTITVDLDDYMNLAGDTNVGRIEAFVGSTDTINLVGAGTAELDWSVEQWYGDDTDQTFILGADFLLREGFGFFAANPFNQSVSAGDGDDTIVNTYYEILTGDFDGELGNDTFISGDDVNADLETDISGAASWASIENLELINGADLTLTADQHEGFTGTVIGEDSNVMNVTTALGDAVTAETLFGDIEYYNLSDDPDYVIVSQGNEDVDLNGGADFVTVNGVTDVRVEGGDGIDTFYLSGDNAGSTFYGDAGDDVFNLSGTVTGTIDDGPGLDEYQLEDGVDVSGLVIDYIMTTEKVTFNGTWQGDPLLEPDPPTPTAEGWDGEYTMTAWQYVNRLVMQDAVRTGLDDGTDPSDPTTGDTIVISDTSTLDLVTPDFDNFVVFHDYDADPDNWGAGTFTKLVLASDGDDTVGYGMTDLGEDAVVRVLDISAGGSDDIYIVNFFKNLEDDANDYLIIDGFDVDDDRLSVLFTTGLLGDGSFQTITESATQIGVNPGGVVEVETSTGSILIDWADTSDGGAVEAIIANAVSFTGTLVGPSVASFVLYANDGNAYIYSTEFTDNPVIDGSDLEVELVGVITDIDANSLSADNFFYNL